MRDFRLHYNLSTVLIFCICLWIYWCIYHYHVYYLLCELHANKGFWWTLVDLTINVWLNASPTRISLTAATFQSTLHLPSSTVVLVVMFSVSVNGNNVLATCILRSDYTLEKQPVNQKACKSNTHQAPLATMLPYCARHNKCEYYSENRSA